MNEICLQLTTQRVLHNCCSMIFTKTWLESIIPYTAMELAGCTAYSADRTADSCNKTSRGFSIGSDHIAQIWKSCCSNADRFLSRGCYPRASGLFLPHKPRVIWKRGHAHESLDDYTTTVLNYINLFVDYIPSWNQIHVSPNQKM